MFAQAFGIAWHHREFESGGAVSTACDKRRSEVDDLVESRVSALALLPQNEGRAESQHLAPLFQAELEVHERGTGADSGVVEVLYSRASSRKCWARSLQPAHDQAPLREERSHLRDVGHRRLPLGQVAAEVLDRGSLRSDGRR